MSNTIITTQELEYFLSKVRTLKLKLDIKTVDIMNRLENSLVEDSTSTGLYWNDPDEGKCSGWVESFWEDQTIGITTFGDSEAEVNSWELEFKQIPNEPEAISEMMRFQSDRQLDKMEYNNLNETNLVLEEIFESFGFDVPKENRKALTNSFKSWMTTFTTNGTIVYDSSKINENGNVKWEESVDSTCDQIVFLIGKLMKLGVDPKLALLEVSKEINSRQGTLIGGKFTKFVEGEEGYEPTYKADYSTCKV